MLRYVFLSCLSAHSVGDRSALVKNRKQRTFVACNRMRSIDSDVNKKRRRSVAGRQSKASGETA